MRKSIPFVALLLIVVGFALLSYKTAQVLFLFFVGYALSGYVLLAVPALRRLSRRPR
jgi:CDP-diacylglycerol--serine O-phosphatidyltransferase